MIINKLTQLLFDNSCILCQSKKLSNIIPFICDNCLSSFENNTDNTCKICGHPLNEINDCPSCKKLGEIYYDHYRFIQYYTGFFKKIVLLWKLKENFMINRLFFELLILKKIIKKDGIITVVPDTFLKKFKRGRSGLNYLLSLFKNNGYEVIRNIYKRNVIFGKSQKMKIEKERIKEISNLYHLPDANYKKYKGKIYLIDDIYTTGSTLNCGAKLLKKAGFSNVNIISFFRAKLDEY